MGGSTVLVGWGLAVALVLLLLIAASTALRYTWA